MESGGEEALSLETVIIVACVCGSVVLVLTVVLIVLCCRRRRTKYFYEKPDANLGRQVLLASSPESQLRNHNTADCQNTIICTSSSNTLRQLASSPHLNSGDGGTAVDTSDARLHNDNTSPEKPSSAAINTRWQQSGTAAADNDHVESHYRRQKKIIYEVIV